MYIETGSIGVNLEQSQEYGSVYINGGAFKGVNVIGQVQNSVLQYSCTDLAADTYSVDLYLDLQRQTINYKVQEINPDACVPGNHIGSVLIECTKCDSKVIGILEKEDPCLKYIRGFDASFGISFNPLQEVINICTSVNGEFLDAFSVDYRINEAGDGIVIDNRIYGDNTFASGNEGYYDGNNDNAEPLTDDRRYGSNELLDGNDDLYTGN